MAGTPPLRQPGGYHVLHPSGSEMERRDPLTRAVLGHVERHGPARPGEQVGITRFAAGRDLHERDPYAVLIASVTSLIEWVSRPLAWSFVTVTDTGH